MAEERTPQDIDVNTPNVARMYDYYLGGKDNFAADRAAAERVLTMAPEVRVMARENRAFLGRAVRYLASVGVRRFIDIGAGLPTRNSVHQAAAGVVPDAQVVYADNDPVVLSHARALLARTDRVSVVQGDLRDPGAFLERPEVVELLDSKEPVAVLTLAILHFVSDEADPWSAMAQIRDALPSGSHLVLSHGPAEARPDIQGDVREVYSKTASTITPRPREEILRFFGDFELVDPGLVYIAGWRPEAPVGDPAKSLFLGGVGRKG